MIQARSGPRRLLVVAGLVALLHALLLSLGASPAAAHATLVSTDPAEGEVLAETPDVVTFTFDERVSLTDQGIRVFDAQGEPVSADASSTDTVVTADLPDELDDGTYVVTYRVVSADGHPIAGSLTFSIGAPSETVVPPDVGDADPTRSMKAAVGIVQGLGYLGLLLAAGLVVFQCWMLGGARVSTATRDLLTRVHVGAVGLAVLAWAAVVPLDGAYQQGFGLGGAVKADAIDLSLVGDDLVVLGLITVGLVLGLLAPRARDFATLGVALAIAAPSVIGHTRAYEPVPLLVVTDVLHLAAGSVWLGGLVGLALTLPSLAGRARDAAEVLARFSAVAAGVLGLLVVSGTLLGWRIIGSWSGLFGTTYGRLLLIKVGVVGLVALVALVEPDPAAAAGPRRGRAHRAATGCRRRTPCGAGGGAADRRRPRPHGVPDQPVAARGAVGRRGRSQPGRVGDAGRLPGADHARPGHSWPQHALAADPGPGRRAARPLRRARGLDQRLVGRPRLVGAVTCGGRHLLGSGGLPVLGDVGGAGLAAGDGVRQPGHDRGSRRPLSGVLGTVVG